MSVQEVARWAVICDHCGKPISPVGWPSKAMAAHWGRGRTTVGEDLDDPGDWCVDCWEARPAAEHGRLL